jgi:hypothetical protein
MKKMLLAAIALVLASLPAMAGGPPPMYVVVQKVVLEPNDKNPKAIQIWGWFTRTENARSFEFTKPAYGFIHLGKGCETDAAIWKKSAGSGKAVAVGSCGDAGTFLSVPIHSASAKPKAPDADYSKECLGRIGSVYAENGLEKQAEVKALLAAAAVKPVDETDMSNFVHDAILAGLNEDGVPLKFAAKVAGQPDFLGKCPLCRPSQMAFQDYGNLRVQPEGKGLENDLRKRLTSAEEITRHEALRDLVRTYMERAYAKSKMSAAEKQSMRAAIEKQRSAGLDGLGRQKFCPSCDGASCFVQAK